MPSPRNQRRADRPRRGGGGSGGCCFPRSTIFLRQPLSAPAQPRRFSTAAGAVSPRPPDAAGSLNNLTALPPGGGSGGPSPVPPSPGESPRRRPASFDALPRFESRQPAAPLPVRRCRPAGWRLPQSRQPAAPALLASVRVRPAAASRHRLASLPSPPNSRGRRRCAARRSRSLPFTRGRARTPLAGLLPPALVGPAPAASPVTGAPAPGPRARSPSRRRELLCGGRRGWALLGSSRVCACIWWDRNPLEHPISCHYSLIWKSF